MYNTQKKGTNVLCAFNDRFLESYVVYLAQIIHQCTKGHRFRLQAFSSHYAEVEFSIIRRLCGYDQSINNVRRVLKNFFINQYVKSKLGDDSETYRISGQKGNRVYIENQLSQEQILQMEKLSDITIEIMQKQNIKDVHNKFQKLESFWSQIQDKLSGELSMQEHKQRKYIESMTVREGQHGQCRNRQIPLSCSTEIVNNILVAIQKRNQKRIDKKNQKKNIKQSRNVVKKRKIEKVVVKRRERKKSKGK
ncbi:Conserved_hypothetical protein [Hexamita inflata]|uniref:Uncharacterized protein n=1 Tax=Hexamita inflata TaxID=28002 RepID=A0ABP1HD48_9EUKA